VKSSVCNSSPIGFWLATMPSPIRELGLILHLIPNNRKINRKMPCREVLTLQSAKSSFLNSNGSMQHDPGVLPIRLHGNHLPLLKARLVLVNGGFVDCNGKGLS
jgi:hypothetical protein